MSVSASLNVNLSVSQSGAAPLGAGVFWSGAMSLLQNFGNGVTAGKVDVVYAAERTVATGANDDIDLNGTLKDALGGNVAALEVVGILIINKPADPAAAANTTNLTLGGNSADFKAFLSTAANIGPIRPGGLFLLMNPDANGLGAVVPTTADILRLVNSAGASNKYQIAVLARSA